MLVAVFISGSEAHSPSTQGSVYWMAPEVAKRTSYTRKADIWSVGCLMVEMLTGEHPWAELDQMQAIFRACSFVTTNIFGERGLIEILNSLALLRSLQFRLISLLKQLISYIVPSRLIAMLVLLPLSFYNMIGSLKVLTHLQRQRF